MLRRFRASNYQSTTSVKPFMTTMPLGLSPGWNQIQFNLADFTRRAYGTNYIETVSIQIHANVRIKRVYFSDRLYSEDEKPTEFRLYNPIEKTKRPRYFRRNIKEAVESARPPSPDLVQQQKYAAEEFTDKNEQMETQADIDKATEEPTTHKSSSNLTIALQAEPNIEEIQMDQVDNQKENGEPNLPNQNEGENLANDNELENLSPKFTSKTSLSRRNSVMTQNASIASMTQKLNSMEKMTRSIASITSKTDYHGSSTRSIHSMQQAASTLVN